MICRESKRHNELFILSVGQVTLFSAYLDRVVEALNWRFVLLCQDTGQTIVVPFPPLVVSV